jgi:porin
MSTGKRISWRRSPRLVAGLLALVLTAIASAAWAQQPAVESPPPTWAEGPTLTGDWGGVRTRLADRGFAPYATYTVEGFGSAGKGIDDGADWTSVLEFGFDVDTQKLVGLPGGSLHASALWIEGTDPSARVGNLNAISSLSAPAAARLYQLWYKQALAPVTVKLGEVLASDDFMVSPSAALYFNAGFGTYPTFTANINAPTYPLGAPGALVQWQVVESLQLQAGVYVADAGPNDASNHGFGWSTDHGWVVFAEIAYKASLGGRAGLYKLGGYYDTARFTDLVTGDSVRGNGSLYVLGDQTVYAGAEGVPTVSVFVGAGLSPQEDRNTVHYYAQAGVNVTGLLPPRPKDTLGLGATYTGISDDFVQANRAAGTPVTSQEAIIELTYQAVITPFLTLQPDLQLVVDANQSRHNAVVLGVRMVATF